MPKFTTDKPHQLGTAGSVSSGSLGLYARPSIMFPFFRMKFFLNAARVNVTDAGASGSFGSLDLFTFNPGVVRFLAAYQKYTAFAEGATLTGGAGDAAFKIGVGTVAVAAAADNALTTTSVDVGAATSVTLSGGTGTGATATALSNIFDGTVTPVKLVLNFSGSAASIDANSTIDVTGIVDIAGVLLYADN